MNKIVIFIAVLCPLWSCVQKSHKQKVNLTLDVSKLDSIVSVGVRGNDEPLDWEVDYSMNEAFKDSIYIASFEGVTGYKFTEIKFVVNGKFELENKENRRIYFDKSGTTNYNAVFNKIK